MVSAAFHDEHVTGQRNASSWALVAAASLFAWLAFLRQRLLADPDILWHIETARWMLAHHAAPHADPFSHTMAGAPWIAKEWLAQLAYAGAYDLAGWTGVALLAAAAIAAAFGLLLRALLEELSPVPAIALTLTGFALAAPHLLARPHVLAFPLIVLWAHGLYRVAATDRAPPWRVLPLMLLWANLHGGFTLGLALVLPAATEAVLASSVNLRARTARRWAAFLALAVLCALVTPYGYESMLVTQRLLGLGDALQVIGEWRQQDFSRIGGFELVLLAGLAVALAKPIRLAWPRIVVLLGLTHLALAHVRNDELLGLIAPLLIAGPIAKGWTALAAPAGGQDVRAPVDFRLLGLAFGAAAASAVWTTRESTPNPAYSPAAAVAAARANGVQGAVFNDLGFGGFLIKEGVPTFIDGRLELFGGPLLLRYHRATSLLDWTEFPALVRTYGVGWTLLEPATPLVGYLDRSPAWRRVHADATAVAHVRVPEVAFP